MPNKISVYMFILAFNKSHIFNNTSAPTKSNTAQIGANFPIYYSKVETRISYDSPSRANQKIA